MHRAVEEHSSKGKNTASKQDFYLGPQQIAWRACYYIQGVLRQLGLITGNGALAINFRDIRIKH